MNSLHTPAKRRQAAGRLYTRIEDESPVRDLSFDKEGVVALCGTQGTNQVFYAERTDVDENEGTMEFRVLRLDPTFKKGVSPNARTGVPEYGKRLLHCQYAITDVQVPALGPRANLGRSLREIQEEFRQVLRSNPLDRGTVNSDREVAGLHQRWFCRND